MKLLGGYYSISVSLMASDLSGTTLGIPKQISAPLCAIDGKCIENLCGCMPNILSCGKRDWSILSQTPFSLDDLYLFPTNE